MGLVTGWMTDGWRFGLKLGLASGLAAAGAFLAATVLQDLFGRRVGAPGAEKTATMLTVAMLGNIVASFVGGGVMGMLIFNQPRSPE